MPAPCVFIHDNPEGRDLASLFTSNSADHCCALCCCPAANAHSMEQVESADKRLLFSTTALRAKIRQATRPALPRWWQDGWCSYWRPTSDAEVASEQSRGMARAAPSTLEGFGFQPLSQDSPLLFNDTMQALAPDELHVLGGVFTHILTKIVAQ